MDVRGSHRPGALVVRDGRVLACGAVESVLAAAGPDAAVTRLPDRLILPLMVNAHVHLDLTRLGPRPYEGDFADWAAAVMAARTAGQCTADAVTQGVGLSRDAGVGWVGDIAGSAEAALALAHSGMPGVSYLECFGQGQRQAAAAHRLAVESPGMSRLLEHAGAGRVRLGWQPHAPYSAGLELYAAAERTGLPLSTHLAETLDEVRFTRQADGPWADRLRQWGKWDDSIQPAHQHPVDWLAPLLRRRPWLLAHCNYLEPGHVALLAQAGASVCYCPIASEYFGHRDHPYRDLLRAGVNVCLGVDSILCQPADEPQPMGLMPVLRRLYARDGMDGATLLAMATTHGLRALGLDESLATFTSGVPARALAVAVNPDDSQDLLRQALSSRYAVEPLCDALGPGSPAKLESAEARASAKPAP
jgi:cytosine/adenosine deaminase-related metal-dependent hydrolase